jgi:hypothetical protein
MAFRDLLETFSNRLAIKEVGAARSMDWQTLIATVAVSTTTIGAVTGLVKSLVSQWLIRDIERFKASLATESTRSVEKLRARLQLEAPASSDSLQLSSYSARFTEVSRPLSISSTMSLSSARGFR